MDTNTAPQPINLFGWFGFKNLGDELSPYLIEKLTGVPPKLEYEGYETKLLAIGSIIGPVSLYTPAQTWGSGILYENQILHMPEIDFTSPKGQKYLKQYLIVLHHNVYKALRGPLTRNKLIKHGLEESQLPKVFGDPAILLPYVYKSKITKPHYKLGIIQHHSQPTQELEKIVNERFADKVKVISIKREGYEQLEQALDEFNDCERIASTSLHGIILAHAYGIPAIFLQSIKLPLIDNSRFKFYDYYMGVNLPTPEPVMFDDYYELIPKLLTMPVDDPPQLRDFCQTLLDVFPYQDMLKLKSLPR